MKKRTLRFLLAAALILAGAVGYSWYRATFVKINGQYYRRDITELNLSAAPVPEPEKLTEFTELELLDLRKTGLTAAEYEMLRSALPDCRILWSVPFQGRYYAQEETDICITELNMSDLEALAYLEHLEAVDAVGCRDYEVLLHLQQTRPELRILYTVTLGGREYREDTKRLVLENADAAEVETAIAYLPELTSVTFTGTPPENDRIYEWMCRYPGITFQWEFTVCGVSTDSMATQLFLNDIPVEDVEEVEASLKYFYNLEWVEMCNCGIPSEEMDALWKRNPETRFVWTVQMGKCTLRTDATVFMPYKFGYDGNKKLYDEDIGELKYCVDLICLDMGHMGIADYSFLEYMPKMKYLVLADTRGTDFSALANLKELVFLELFMTGFNQAEVLLGLTNLEDLNIGNSRLDDIDALLEMTWLERLWLPANVLLSSQERVLIRDTLTDTQVVFSGTSSTGGGWRESPNYYAMRDLLEMGYLKG